MIKYLTYILLMPICCFGQLSIPVNKTPEYLVKVNDYDMLVNVDLKGMFGEFVLISSHLGIVKVKVKVRKEEDVEFKRFCINNGLSYEENVFFKPIARSNDPNYYLQWQFLQSNPLLFDNDLDIEDAWQYTTDGFTNRGDTIVIAVIDEGIKVDHEDLINSIWHNRNEIPNNKIDDDKNGYIDDYLGWNSNEHNDNINNSGIGHWHGTPVAGIIGAMGNWDWRYRS